MLISTNYFLFMKNFFYSLFKKNYFCNFNLLYINHFTLFFVAVFALKIVNFIHMRRHKFNNLAQWLNCKNIVFFSAAAAASIKMLSWYLNLHTPVGLVLRYVFCWKRRPNKFYFFSSFCIDNFFSECLTGKRWPFNQRPFAWTLCY